MAKVRMLEIEVYSQSFNLKMLMLLSSSSILCCSRPDAAATKCHLVALPCFAAALPGFDSCPFSVLEGEGGLDGGLSTDMVPENRLTDTQKTDLLR